MTTKSKAQLIPPELLAEICADPGNLAPRWIVADYLEERGDPRGPFIRAQLRLEAQRAEANGTRDYPFPASGHAGPSSGVPSSGERVGLRQLADTLLDENRGRWDRALARCVQRCSYRSGFVEHVRIALASLIEHASAIFCLAPIRAVTIIGDATRVAALQDCPPLTRLEGLRFQGGWLGFAGAEALAACRPLEALQYLEVPNNGWGVEAVRVALTAPNLQRLAGIDLARNPDVGRRGAELLLQQRPTGGWKRLSLRGCGITNRFTRSMSAWPGLGALEWLDLRDNGITISGYDALFSSPFWNRRTCVQLNDREHHVLNRKLGDVYHRASN